MKGFIINTSQFHIVRNCEFEPKIIEDLYVRVDGKDLIPSIYVYPIAAKETVLSYLETLKKAKAEYNKIVEGIFYRDLPNVRRIYLEKEN